MDNGLSINPKRLNKMLNSILALLFLVKLFLKSKFYAPKILFNLSRITAISSTGHHQLKVLIQIDSL